MTEETFGANTSKLVIIAITVYVTVGAIGAFLVAREPAGYVASMVLYLLVFFVLFPLIVILLISAIIAATQNSAKYAAIFLTSCLLVPISFFGSLKLIEVLGMARYKILV